MYNSLQLASLLRELTRHGITHPAAVTFSRWYLVFDLATPEGCKAELT